MLYHINEQAFGICPNSMKKNWTNFPFKKKLYDCDFSFKGQHILKFSSKIYFKTCMNWQVLILYQYQILVYKTLVMLKICFKKPIRRIKIIM